MIIESTASGKISAFQRMPGNSKKVGFICEDESIGEATSGIVELVAKHCAATGDRPMNILEKAEIR